MGARDSVRNEQRSPLTRRAHFDALADALCVPTPGTDRVTLALKAEGSDFVRFNRSAVRQATQVSQGHATLAVMRGRRRSETRLALSGRLADDIAALRAERGAMLAQLDELPDDPHLLLPEGVSTSERDESGRLPSAEQLVRAVAATAAGLDFVGFYAGGDVVRAFADDAGSRHWHRVESFHIDWCLYHAADRAVKSAYAGTHWDDAEFARRVDAGRLQLPLLALPPRRLSPGEYRAWFAPAAMGELLSVLGWSGFSGRARRTGTSSLVRLEHGDAAMHPDIHIEEDTAGGIAPAFTADGFTRPGRIALVEGGRAGGTLNSSRTAREYGLPANGANMLESPESLSLRTGSLPSDDALAALDHGLVVSNLWYLNYSDRQACRATGMTRFACFWVEDGRLVAPVSVMRFDDSLLRMFGEGLLGLGDRAEIIPENSTYENRHLASVTTPGALVDGWRLTL